MSAFRVVVADDHALFREGIVSLLSGEERIQVVGEASDGAAAVEAVHRTRPDLLLLDVSMPGMSPLATIAAVRRTSVPTRIVILTMHKDAVLRRSLLAAGAEDFWSKTIPSPELIRGVIDLGVRAHERPAAVPPIAADITPREGEVLRLVGRACSNREIADRLHIAEGTVKRHLNSIFQKLGAVSRMDAVLKAERLGVLSTE